MSVSSTSPRTVVAGTSGGGFALSGIGVALREVLGSLVSIATTDFVATGPEALVMGKDLLPSFSWPPAMPP